MTHYVCKACQWQGYQHQLDYETVETCMGSDKIELCPACGGMDVRFVHQIANN